MFTDHLPQFLEKEMETEIENTDELLRDYFPSTDYHGCNREAELGSGWSVVARVLGYD